MASKGGGDNFDSGAVLLIICVGMMVGIYYLILYNFHYIADVWRYVRAGEIYLLSLLPEWVPYFGEANLPEVVEFLIETPGDIIDPSTVGEFDRHYARYYAWLPALVLIFIGCRQIVKSENVASSYNMETLLAFMSRAFPHLEELKDTNPVKKPLEFDRDDKESYAYGMPVTPEQFALMDPPLGLEKEAESNHHFKRSIWDEGHDFDRDLCYRAFSAQLGEHYEGTASLNSTELRFWKLLVSKIHYDARWLEYQTLRFMKLSLGDKSKKSMNEENKERLLHKRISLSVPTQELSVDGLTDKCLEYYKIVDEFCKLKKSEGIKNKEIYSKASELIKTCKFAHKNEMYAEYIMGCHSFKRTGFMSLLVVVRLTGIFTSDSMRWIKKEDRILAICSSIVGRKVAFTEAAGCYAHWRCEILVGRPLSHPEVEEAVEGLHTALGLKAIDD